MAWPTQGKVWWRSRPWSLTTLPLSEKPCGVKVASRKPIAALVLVEDGGALEQLDVDGVELRGLEVPELDLAGEAGEGDGGGGRVGRGVVGERAHGLVGVFGVVLRDGRCGGVACAVGDYGRAIAQLDVEREGTGGGA